MEEKDLIGKVEFLQAKLSRFGIKSKVTNVVCCPAYTAFYFESEDKKCVTKINTFKKDLEILYGLDGGIRFLPKKTGQDYYILEIPNQDRKEVSFQEVSKNKEYRRTKWKLPLAIGWATCDELAMRDMVKTGNILVAGSNEWELNNFYKSVLSSLTERKTATDVQIIPIDKKGIMTSQFDGLKNILIPQMTGNIQEYTSILKWILWEAERRKKILYENKLDDIADLNAFSTTKLPYIVTLVRNVWEFMEEEEFLLLIQKVISDIAPLSKKIGMYFYFATKKADRNLLTDAFRENFLTKIAFSLSDSTQSSVLFRQKGAENLLGDGDMFVKKGAKVERLQASVVDETCVKQILKANGKRNKDFVPLYHADEILQGVYTEPVGKFFDFAMACDLMKQCYEKEGVVCESLEEFLGENASTLQKILLYWKQKGFLKIEEENWQITLPQEDFNAFLSEKEQ